MTISNNNNSFPLEGEPKGAHILITAGPTYEKIDPVRFIGNYSSGKMGIALAEECLNRGMQVELVLGPVTIQSPIFTHPRLHLTNVESAQQMYEACMDIYPRMNAAILCAAVADFTPETVAPNKIKRKGDELIIRLKPTKDIAAALGKIKTDNQLLVGFALETNDEETNAQDKMKRKNFDFIVLNSLNDQGAGFRHDTNKITIISQTSKTEYPLKEKKACAVDIIDKLEKLLKKC